MSELISRQVALDALTEYWKGISDRHPTLDGEMAVYADCKGVIKRLPSAQPHWIPCSDRLPEDLSEVNVTWINTNPEPYYDFIKGERFTGSAVYYKGKWYWYSSTTKDVLAEYGRYDSEEFDEAIECIAWMPLPDLYKGETNE